MERIYVFIIRNDVWIYILSGLGLIWYFSEFWRARRMLRSAVFGLEKERGQRLQRRSLLFVFTFLSIIALITYINRSVAPTLPAELLKPPTPTPNIFATPLSSPTPIGGVNQSTPTIAIAPTVTLPIPVDSIDETTDNINPTEESSLTVEETPTISIVGCSAPVNITSPADGIPVSGEVTFFGSVELENLNSYELEARGPQTGSTWLSIQRFAGIEPISDGALGIVNLSNWLPGSYNIRLNVFNEEEILIGQCSVEIILQSPTS